MINGAVGLNLAVSPAEVLPYLAMPKDALTPPLSDTINQIITEMTQTIRPKYVFAFSGVTPLEQGISADDLAFLLKGRSIANHLKGADKLVLMACTLGIEVEHMLQRYRLLELTKAVIADAVASALVEALCDRVTQIILAAPDCAGLYPNGRFSPGYGDFPLESQPALLTALGAAKAAGIQCSENYIMIPRKSVTAVIGLFKTRQSLEIADPCSDCQFRHNCSKRERGESCGRK